MIIFFTVVTDKILNFRPFCSFFVLVFISKDAFYIFRTWLEPSKQVASFIYSTLKSLAVTEVPELKPVGLQVHSILSLVKPVVLNIQYAQNLHFAKLVNYLEMIVHQEISWVASPESFIPARMSVNALLYGQAYAVQATAFTAYIRGMEKWIDLIMKNTLKIKTSTQVQTQLQKITKELGIAKKPVVAPEIFAQYGLFDTDVTAYLNEPMIVEALSQLADKLYREAQSLNGKKHLLTSIEDYLLYLKSFSMKILNDKILFKNYCLHKLV